MTPEDKLIVSLSADLKSAVEALQALYAVTIGYQNMPGETLHPMTVAQLNAAKATIGKLALVDTPLPTAPLEPAKTHLLEQAATTASEVAKRHMNTIIKERGDVEDINPMLDELCLAILNLRTPT